MKSIVKHIVFFAAFVVGFPLLAGWLVSLLWNSVIVSACGFAAINLLQGIGLLCLGMLLTFGGFAIGMMILGGLMHIGGGRHRHSWHHRWHEMTDEQRREFIEQRRRGFGFPGRHPFANFGKRSEDDKTE